MLRRSAVVAAVAVAAAALGTQAPGRADDSAGSEGEPPIPLEALEGRWVEMRGPQFVFVSDGGKMATASLADRLASFRKVVMALSNAREFRPRVPSTVYVFSRVADYQRVTGKTEFTPGFFVPGPGGNALALLDRTSSGRTILLHEYTHFLLRNQGSFRPPLWYNEGFADFVAPTAVADPMLLGRPNPMRLPQGPRDGLLDLQRLLGARRYADLEPEEIGDFYKTSWILVHFLHMRRRDEMLGFLDRYSRGELGGNGDDAAFGIPLEQLERELGAYWSEFRRAGRLPVLRLDEARFRAVAPLETTELSGAAAAVRLAELALAAERPATAAPLAEAVLARDRNDARAHAVLAAVRLAEGDWEAAEAHGLRAVKIDEAGASGHLAVGNALLAALAGVGDAESPALPEAERGETLRRARRHFERGIELEPEQPAAHLGLGHSYLFEVTGEASGVAPGFAAAARARELLGPENPVLFLEGALELHAGRPARARALLEEVIAWDHHGGFGEQAQKLLDAAEAEAAQESK